MRSILTAALLALFLALGGANAAFAQSDDDTDPGATAFNNGDYAAAMAAWKPRAADNDPEAMNNIGNLYFYGLGVKKDLKQAAAWYEKAAQLGFVLAQFNLANLDYDRNDLKQAARWYMAAAQGGHAKAMYYLAQMYEDGDGVAKDQAQAANWYAKAAAQGLPEGAFEYGRKLVNGEGVEQNNQKGSDMVLKAAEAGYGRAQYTMAGYYYRGKVVPKNLIEAYVWATQATQTIRTGRDLDRAKDLLSDIKSGMTGQERQAAEIELQAVAPRKSVTDSTKATDQSGSASQ
jgi:TPR repeat protein